MQLTQFSNWFLPETEVLTAKGFCKLEDFSPKEPIAVVRDDKTLFETVRCWGYHEQYWETVQAVRKNEKESIIGEWNLETELRLGVALSSSARRQNVWAAVGELKGFSNLAFLQCAPLSGQDNILTPIDRLQIATQADGVTDYKPRKAAWVTRLGFSKERKIERLDALLKSIQQSNMQLEYYILDSSTTTFAVYTEFAVYKKFEDWVNFATKGALWCQMFLMEVSHWDSYVKDNREFSFSNLCTGDVGFVQAAAALSGYGTRLNISRDRLWVVTVYRDRPYSNYTLRLKRTPAQKRTWCFLTPKRDEDGFILRHNGFVFIAR